MTEFNNDMLSPKSKARIEKLFSDAKGYPYVPEYQEPPKDPKPSNFLWAALAFCIFGLIVINADRIAIYALGHMPYLVSMDSDNAN